MLGHGAFLGLRCGAIVYHGLFERRKCLKSQLAQALRDEGQPVTVTYEPGATPAGKKIRGILLEAQESVAPRAEALLFAAARSDHVERLILPAIARGAWVICDRFVDSSRAYQGGGGGLSDDDVMELHRIGSQHRLELRTRQPLRFGTRHDHCIQPGGVRYAPGVRAGRWIFATGHKGTADFVSGMAPEVLSRSFAALAAYAVTVSGPAVHLGDIEALRKLAQPSPTIDDPTS